MSLRREFAVWWQLALAVGLVAAVSALSWNARMPAAAPAQVTPTATVAPTDVPPTPIPVTGTAEPTDHCVPGVPSPRLFWTLYVAPQVSNATGMWVPYREKGGPFLRAHVKALYGDVWYGATIDGVEGRIRPDPYPAWPRPDLIQFASSGVQTSRVGNPMCGRPADATLPPCYAELVVPLVFLDRITTEGPFLRNTYFWVPSNQVVDEDGSPSRVTALAYDAQTCDTAQIGPRLASARPVYHNFSGCSSASTRVDTCYLAGCGDQWEQCR